MVPFSGPPFSFSYRTLIGYSVTKY